MLLVKGQVRGGSPGDSWTLPGQALALPSSPSCLGEQPPPQSRERCSRGRRWPCKQRLSKCQQPAASQSLGVRGRDRAQRPSGPNGLERGLEWGGEGASPVLPPYSLPSSTSSRHPPRKTGLERGPRHWLAQGSQSLNRQGNVAQHPAEEAKMQDWVGGKGRAQAKVPWDQRQPEDRPWMGSGQEGSESGTCAFHLIKGPFPAPPPPYDHSAPTPPSAQTERVQESEKAGS